MEQVNINQFYEWMKALSQKDSVDFDIYGFCQDRTEISFQKKELKTCNRSSAKHLNLRVLQGDKTGVSYTKDFSKTSLETCYRKAFDSLKISDKKERGYLSVGETYQDLSSFYDESCKSMSLEDKVQKAQSMNKACLEFDEKVQPIYSSLYDYENFHFFTNSQGQKALCRSNDIVAYNYSLAVQGESRSQGLAEKSAKHYKDIPFEKLGEDSATQALKKLNYSIPKTGKYPVVFKTGQAVSSLLLRLVALMSGKKVYEGLSLFKDSLGKQVLSDKLSFLDDPFVLWGFDTRAFDGEGFSMEKTSLVKNGVLENYLTSSFFAKALNVPHTKKADWDEEGRLDVSHTHLIMEEGEHSFKELVEELPKTVLIDKLIGFAGYNAISGDFSIESEGFLWDGGEAKPLCQFTVSGNIKDVFSNILKVGKESEIFSGGVKAPSFLVPELMIAGQ